MIKPDLSELLDFLNVPTPKAWIDAALKQQDILLIDHAHCEKKAASTALHLMYRYKQYPDLLQKMSRLAREELRHFEKVHQLLCKRGIEYVHLSPSRYAARLREAARSDEPNRLIDVLIIGALIEARSCERFHTLAPYLDKELQTFYLSLLKSEARHFKDYLHLAEKIAQQDISDRVEVFTRIDADLVSSGDGLFRFHSGVPSKQ